MVSLQAHKHDYERSFPLYQGKFIPNYNNPGYPTYIVNGAGGNRYIYIYISISISISISIYYYISHPSFRTKIVESYWTFSYIPFLQWISFQRGNQFLGKWYASIYRCQIPTMGICNNEYSTNFPYVFLLQFIQQYSSRSIYDYKGIPNIIHQQKINKRATNTIKRVHLFI